MNKLKVVIIILVVLVSGTLLINGYINEEGKQDVVEIPMSENKVQISNESTTTSTTSTKTTKTTKNALKTTKTVQKTTRKVVKSTKTVQKFNIKYNKQDLLDYARELLKQYGWNEKDYQALVNIGNRESGWNPNSVNKKSGACGVFQAHPCNKTIKNGYKDYYTNWKTQVKWGMDYIMYRYKTPTKAWEYWQKHGNY